MDNPDLYNRTNLMQSRDVIEFLEHITLTLNWKTDEHILDVGCGPGNVTYNILLQFIPPTATVVASDISGEMVIFASSKYPDQRLFFKILDIESKDIWKEWKKNTFDKIFSFYCLHWILNFRQAVKNLYNLLKKDGEAYLLFLAVNPMFSLCKELIKHDKWKHYIQDLSYVRGETKGTENCMQCEYGKVFKEEGFRTTKVNVIKKTFCFQSLENLLSSLEALDPLINKIPDDLKEEYMEFIKDIIFEKRLAIDIPGCGKVKVEYTLIQIIAKK